LPPIDFAEVKTVEDLKSCNITFDQLLDSLNNLKLDDAKPKEDQDKSKAEYIEQKLRA
jgi:hypothetical protein